MEKKYTKKQIDEMWTRAIHKTLEETEAQTKKFLEQEKQKDNDGMFVATQVMSATITLAQFKHYFWEGK